MDRAQSPPHPGSTQSDLARCRSRGTCGPWGWWGAVPARAPPDSVLKVLRPPVPRAGTPCGRRSPEPVRGSPPAPLSVSASCLDCYPVGGSLHRLWLPAKLEPLVPAKVPVGQYWDQGQTGHLQSETVAPLYPGQAGRPQEAPESLSPHCDNAAASQG